MSNPSRTKRAVLDRLQDDLDRRLALENAAEYCSDTAAVFWNVTVQRGIPRELRADLNAAIELLRKIRAGVQAAERGRS